MTSEKPRNRFSRRVLLQTSAAAGALAALPTFVPSHVFGRAGIPSANDRIHLGVIGLGMRGKYLIGDLPDQARVTAICDCATWQIAETLRPKPRFAPILAAFRERDAENCATYQDYRRLMDREKLDAVIIAAPDHHHVLAAMLACEAGLDVYVEKPLSMTIAEGRRLVDTVKRTGRVVQVGSQQRTMEINRFACEFVRSGGLGRVSKIELSNYPGPLLLADTIRAGSLPRTYDTAYDLPEEALPEGLDWELFCGPTHVPPYNRRLWVKDEFRVSGLLWRGWDLWRDYSGHIMTNWGAHNVDMAQHALGRDDSGPVEVWPVEPPSARPLAALWSHKTPPPGEIDGLNRIRRDKGAAPASSPAVDERRFWPVFMRYDDDVELQFILGPDYLVIHGERGKMTMRRNHFEVDPPELVKDGPGPEACEIWKGRGIVARPHLENWCNCIRTREVTNAPVETGHRTATICHLANIARELNRKLHWHSADERFLDDQEANRLVNRARRKGFELPA
jgi:hypothetical protein